MMTNEETRKNAHRLIRMCVKRRKELGLSQKDLAELIGSSQPFVARFETGTGIPTLTTFFRILDSLQLRMALRVLKEGEQNV